MSLTLNGLILMLTLSAMAQAFASEEQLPEKKYRIASQTTREIFPEESHEKGIPRGRGMGGLDPVQTATQVISIARDLVALGEDVYELVIKGKPTNETKYEPISVLPRINNEPASILDTEFWKAPVKRTFEASYKNYYNAEVVRFRYRVMYSYGGTYNGKGAYLTAVQIVPEFVKILYGFDFKATMKLAGIVNQGSRENPIAGATLLMEYTVVSFLDSRHVTESYFVNGKNQFRKL
jgi:hypothetical protein